MYARAGVLVVGDKGSGVLSKDFQGGEKQDW